MLYYSPINDLKSIMMRGAKKMLKSELVERLEELFAIGGNHDTVKSIEMRHKFKGFLSQDEYLLGDHDRDNENVRIARDTIRFIDANNTYANTSCVVEASKHLNPFFDRLLQQEKWNYYELLFFVGSSHVTESVEQAIRLGLEAIIKSVEFYNKDRIGILEGHLSCNTCARILYAKYFDEDADKKYFLSGEFQNWFERLRRLARDHKELEVQSLVTKIRHALFERNETAKYMKELEENHDKKIVDSIEREVQFYMTSNGYMFS